VTTTAARGGWYPATLLCAALTCALAPAYTIRWHIGFYPSTLLEDGILVTIAIFLIETYRGPRKLEWRTPFTYPALLFLLAGAISVVAAPDRRAALGLYRAYLIEPAAFFFVVSTVARTAERALLMALGLGVGAVGLAIPNAMVVLDAARHHTLNVSSTTPVAIYLTANAVALFLVPLIALAGSVLLFRSGRPERVVSLIFLAIALPTVLLTLSRGGFVALAAVVFGLAMAHRRRWWLLAASVGAAIIFALIPPVTARLAVEVNLSNGSNTLVGRWGLWSATLKMLRDHPLFGAGLSGFAERLGPYWNPGHSDRFIDPHNIVLNFWSETGILGVIAFAWILVTVFKVSWRGWIKAGPDWRAIHLGVFLAMVAVIVHGLVDVPYFKNDLSFEFWALVAFTWAGTRWGMTALSVPPRTELTAAPAGTPPASAPRSSSS
jgi:putative inorganic carbon (HCO3(-)) transporter